MYIKLEHKGIDYRINLAEPIDISIPIQAGFGNPTCFWAPPVEFTPVRDGDFVGDTLQGSCVNFKNVRINPHGNGTHTECVGHISTGGETIHQALKTFHHIAKLVTIYPTMMPDGDRIITLDTLKTALEASEATALVIRTMPNDDTKLTRNYSGTNPPYVHHEALQYMVDCGIEHLLLDLPSVDRESDEGKMLGHKAFWQYPEQTRHSATITEMIFVPNHIKDGLYLLNTQIASFELDASPSKPVLFKMG
jgi:arylformamidase